MGKTLRALIVCAVALSGAIAANACEMHQALGLSEPMGIWLSNLSTTSAPTLPLAASIPLAPVTDPAITHWRLNTKGTKAHSSNATLNSYISSITADVDTVAYDSSHVYIHTSGVPSYDVGPFLGNPAYPANQNRTVRIPRVPQVQTGTKTNAGLGNIGVMVNGASFFNPRDAVSYNNQNIWHQNANVFEASSFDAGPGHPAPGMQQPQPGQLVAGNYHYHQAPLALLNQLDPGNTGQHHSPIIGYAFDGFPVYGPYGYANGDGTGGIVRETSSYTLRSGTQRHSLADGTPLASNQWGPDVSAQYPVGAYVEDYAYSAGAGLLDQYNGRFTVTPEYPDGTYAYFACLDASGSSVYPYIIGPQYYGVVDTGNLQGGSIIVPANVTYYTAPEPATLGLLMVLLPAALRRRRR